MPDTTADRFALRQLAESYAIGCDSRDADLLRSLFVDGATITVHWPGRTPSVIVLPEAADSIPASLAARYDRTYHFVGNHRAVLDGDVATGVTYCTAHHLTAIGGDANPRDDVHDHVMVIRYEDTYRRTGDGWRFASRDLRVDWTESRTVTA